MVRPILQELPFDTSALAKNGSSSWEQVELLSGWLVKTASDLRDAEAALPWQTENER
eukprot:SAG11_NODE_12089_length_722_cov_1.221509_1_plen_57_part_00